MITVIFANSTSTSRIYSVELTEKLCKPYCINSDFQPSVEVQYSIVEKTLVGTTLYVRVKAQGTVTYVPKCGCNCNPSQKVFTEFFTLLFVDATTTTNVTLTQSAGLVEPAYVNCYNVACGISALNQLTFTVS